MLPAKGLVRRLAVRDAWRGTSEDFASGRRDMPQQLTGGALPMDGYRVLELDLDVDVLQGQVS